MNCSSCCIVNSQKKSGSAILEPTKCPNGQHVWITVIKQPAMANNQNHQKWQNTCSRVHSLCTRGSNVAMSTKYKFNEHFHLMEQTVCFQLSVQSRDATYLLKSAGKSGQCKQTAYASRPHTTHTPVMKYCCASDMRALDAELSFHIISRTSGWHS